MKYQPEQTIQRAITAFEQQRWDDGLEICNSILSQNPRHVQALQLLGLWFKHRHQYGNARQQFSKAHELARRDPSIIFEMGQMSEELGDFDNAMACYERALDIRLLYPEVHAARDALRKRLGLSDPCVTVTVVIPTTGAAEVRQAIESVQGQTHPHVEVMIFADGQDATTKTRAILSRIPDKHPLHIIDLPYNVGAGGFCGHRIYGAASYLARGDYVAFLDQDNWFDSNHIETMVDVLTREGRSWVHSLRRIVNVDGQFLRNDDCECLGKWATWNDSNRHLVDTNCYLLRRDLAITYSPVWYRRFRDTINPDFALCELLLNEQPNFTTTGRYTVNYRVDEARAGWSVQDSFFEKGNQEMARRYPEGFPWRTPE